MFMSDYEAATDIRALDDCFALAVETGSADGE
jgi:hypothetical protein